MPSDDGLVKTAYM